MTTIELAIEGIPAGTLDPWEVIGSEAISSLYSFDIACSLLGDRPAATIVGNSATLTITPDGGTARVIYGIVESFRVASSIVASRPPIIHIRLVPRFALQKRYRQNQIFGTTEALNVKDLIQRQMEGTLRRTNLSGGVKPSIPYAMRLQETYPSHDHIAQYKETNFDFLARQTERWGVSWFFETNDGSEQVVFADDNISAPFIATPAPIDWQGWSGGAAPAHSDGTIQLLEALHEHGSGKVYLHDYNYETPNVNLTAEQTAEDTGIWTDTDEQLETVKEGEMLAEVRIENFEEHRFRLTGRSTVPLLAAGHAFTLRDHPFDDWNQDYLVVSVEHQVRVSRPNAGFDEHEATGYVNRFIVQPLSVRFRPDQVTPRPRIAGVLSGKIESNTHSTAPYMDNQGRYRVRMTFDLSNAPPGFGSCWMRLATPFAGDKDGLHFPLHPGTDVIIAHVDGDPDRPVIVGATFNPATPNVVTNANPGQNRINVRSGMGLTAQTSTVDGTGSPQAADGGGNSVFLWASYQNSNYAPSTVAPTPYQWLRLGEDVDFTGLGGKIDITEGSNAADGFDLATGGSGRLFAPRDLFLIRNGSTTASAAPETKSDTNNRLIAITDSSMLLAHDGTITIGEASGASGYPAEIVMNTAGSITQNVGTNETTEVFGESYKTTHGDTYSMEYGNTVGFTFGSKDTIVGGANTNVYLALNASLTAGLSLSSVIGMELKLMLGGSFAMIYPYEFKLVHQKAEMAILSSIEYKPFSFAVKAKKVDVDMLDTKLKAIENKIGDVKTDVSNLDTKVGNVDTKVGNVDTKVGSVETQVKDVKSDVVSIYSGLNEIGSKIGTRIYL